MRATIAVTSLFVLAVACGGSTSSSDGSNSSPSQSDGGAAADGSGPAQPAGQGHTFGTYIALGDSISDRGGIGPYFYDLFLKNDDATYPNFKGKDLTARFPGIQYVHAAIAGAVSGPYTDAPNSLASKLTDQISKLGSSYPGDVLVTITIGGNDLSNHASDAALGQDAKDKTQLAANLAAALGELTKPGRLGSGKVVVLETNIYDASDGKGNWRSGGGARCPPFDTGADVDTGVFGAWNQVVTTAIGNASGDNLVDLHTLFKGHGFNSMDNWFDTDCIHPTAKGHNELRREMWRMLTGDSVAE
jgi:lysophospholipase L1-like esterase